MVMESMNALNLRVKSLLSAETSKLIDIICIRELLNYH